MEAKSWKERPRALVRFSLTLFLLVLVLPGLVASSDARAQSLAPAHVDSILQVQLERLADDFRGRVGIYARHVPTGRTAAVHADTLFPTASLIKVPILLTTFARIEEGALDYDQTLVFRDSLRYEAPEDLLVWFEDGAEITLSEVVMLMLTTSDNTAALWLQQLVGTAAGGSRGGEGRFPYRWGRGGVAVNTWLAAHGFERTRVNSGVPGREAAHARYGWGQTTPREMAEMLVMIRRGRAVSPAASAEMYRALTRSYWDDRALSQIPPTVQAASKQGWVRASRSEVVLVNAPSGDYVFCIITAEQADTSWAYDNPGYALIRDVSQLLWNYFEPQSGWRPSTDAARRYYYVPE